MNMVQATDDDAMTADNVRPIRPDVTPEPQPRRERPKDHRAAARKAKSRSKNKIDRDAGHNKVTPVYAPPIAPTVTPSDVEDVTLPAHATAPRWRSAPASQRAAEHHRIDRLTLLAALALATVSAGFSIYGFTSIFVGAFWPVIGMGVALELGKLRAVTWIGRNGSSPTWGLKGALTVLVLVLMGLNVVGAFGFLAKAHIGHQVERDVAVAGRAADIEARISVQADVVPDLDRRIAQIDGAVEKSTAKGRTNAAMQLAADQRRNRSELAAQRDQANKALAELKIEKAKVDGDKRVAEADLGPVRYLAKMIGGDDQDVLRWFILVVSILLDPAAVLLLLAATRR
jgi:hypothetical protein